MKRPWRRVVLTLTAAEKRALQDVALSTGRPVGTVIRAAVARYLRRKPVVH